MSPRRWLGRALITGLVLPAAGGVLGLVVGRGSVVLACALGGVGALVALPLTQPLLGRGCVVAALFVAGATWSGARVGETWWSLRDLTVVPVAAVEAWPRGARAVRVPTALRPLTGFAETVSWRTRGRREDVHHDLEAVPLAASDTGRVVAFACGAPGRSLPNDATVLSVVGVDTPHCAWAATRALRRLAVTGRALAPDAASRVAAVHRDEAALRASHGAGATLGCWAALFALYALSCAAHAARARR